MEATQGLLPPFRLYGQVGCPHCVEAQNFLLKENLPYLVVVTNDDPVADAGLRAFSKTGEPKVPLLVCTFSKQIVEGFPNDEYRKLADAYNTLFRPSTPNVSAGEQQPQPEVAGRDSAAPAVEGTA